MGFTKLPLYWRTLRHLKPAQFCGRLLHHLPRHAPAPAAAPPLRACGAWQVPVRRETSLVGPSRWSFLGETREVSTAADWDRPEQAKLWRYNLHYFDDLSADGAATRSAWHHAAIARWVAENPPVAGSGWEPYPTSLRITNWIKWALAGHQLEVAALASLAQQVRWLTRRLEVHLLGNHLFANAKALVFAGLFFDGPEAARWLARGDAILTRELPEQVLSDGGHFERSTMYHALALEDVLDLVNIARCFATQPLSSLDALTATAPRMYRWLQTMCHPDGEIAFFNDAALGIAPSSAELLAYAQRLDMSPMPLARRALRVLQPSGYARLERGPACMLIDAAPIGPDHLPGHAHADTLSFELSLGTQRVFVNSGTSLYGLGAERQRQRGTAAHNTVVVGGHDSSEVWAGFRVGRRARVSGWKADDVAPATSAQAMHDGYRWLPGRPLHTRRWRLDESTLRVIDEVAPGNHAAEARFHLHPAAQVHSDHVRLPGGTVVRWQAGDGSVRWEPSTYHPRFGTSEPSQCMVVTLAAGRSDVTFDWTAA